MRFIWTVRLLLLAGILGGVAGGFWILSFETPYGEKGTTIDFELPEGSTSRTAARNLEKEGLISSATLFRVYLRTTGQGGNLKAGYYELPTGQSIARIATLLTEGRVRMQSFTIPEGWHNRQIAELLESEGLIQDREEFLSETRRPDILQHYSIPADSTEGYLFPDTYTIPDGYPVAKIHRAMLRRFFEVLKQANPPADLTAASLHEAVILASIIEREAAKPEELPEMAGVFRNRLQQGMRLESCATVQYLLPHPRQKLYERDLKIASPYNTYLHRGLPAGPISNPGLPALKAALHPEKSDDLFFVLKPDGSHYFSSSYREHLRAKKRFLDNREGY